MYVKPINPCLAYQNAAVTRWLCIFFLSNFSSCGFPSFLEPRQHYRNNLAPAHPYGQDNTRKQDMYRNRDEWSALANLQLFNDILCLFPPTLCNTTLQVDCTRRNSKCWLWSVCKSRQGSASAGPEKSRFRLSSKLQYKRHPSTSIKVLRFWAVAFPEAGKAETPAPAISVHLPTQNQKMPKVMQK